MSDPLPPDRPKPALPGNHGQFGEDVGTDDAKPLQDYPAADKARDDGPKQGGPKQGGAKQGGPKQGGPKQVGAGERS